MAINRLRTLYRFELNKLLNKEDKLAKKWVKEKRCGCVKFLKEGRILNCKHFNEECNIQFKKDKEKVSNLAQACVMVHLSKNPLIEKEWLLNLFTKKSKE